MFRRLALILVLTLLSTSCGWLNTYLVGSDRATQAAKLEPISQPIAVQKLWEARVGSGTGRAFIKLTPAVDRGRVYAASHDGTIAAVDANSGAVAWRANTKLTISAGVGLGDGLALVGTSKGEVLALDMNNGEEVWRAQVSSEILASPRVAEGVVVVRSIDGKFTGLDSLSGARLWVYEHSVPVLTLRGSAPPLLAQGLVIAGLNTGRLLVLALHNGAPVWEKTIAVPQGRTELERMVDIDSEPRVVGNVLYVVAYQGNITAIDLRDGSTLWTRDISSYAGLDADGRQIYVVDAGDEIWALDGYTGSTVWRQPGLTGRALTTPVASGDYVVVGDFEGYLHWLSKEGGELVGRARMNGRGITAPPAPHGDTLYVLSKGGRLSAMQVQG